MKRPNVVVITLDTMRADHMGCYGYFRKTSPNLDELAASSVLFERCLVPMSTTLPSHTSMFTGVWPAEHGVLANVKKQFIYERDPSLVTLAEVFEAAGYRTAAFVSAYPLRAEAGLATGFEVYNQPTRSKERDAAQSTRQAMLWLKDVGQQPFFLWVHYFDPHGPYLPPSPYNEAFKTTDELRQWLGDRAVALTVFRSKVKRTEQGHKVNLLRSVNQYDGEIAFMDHHIGVLLDHLKEANLWNRTVVAVMGDHGEGLNQHREPGHGFSWDEQVRVPFLLRAPGLDPRKEGRLVSATDLGPTLFGLANLIGSEKKTAYEMRSRGFDVLHDSFEPRPLLVQSSARAELTEHRSELGLTTDRWKFMHRSDGGSSLFDLDRDPFELHDVAVLYPKKVVELSAVAERLLAEQTARGQSKSRPATEEELDSLRALGYGGDDD
jgi:arylsulfatase